MKIRDRLSLIITLSLAGVLFLLSLFIYFFSSNFHRNEFFNRLDERVAITEQLFLEEDNLDPVVYQQIRENFLHTLEQESEEVFKVAPDVATLRDSLIGLYPSVFIDNILESKFGTYSLGNRQGVGRFYEDNEGDYVIIVSAVDTFGISKLRNLSKILIVGFIVSIMVIALISQISTRRALQPLEATIQRARRISGSNLHLRLNVYNENDELGVLATTFNQMLDRLQEAFDAQRQFISNASHEIRNPLTAIMGESELSLEKERSTEEYHASLTTILNEANRLDQLVSHLLNLANTGFDATNIQHSPVRIDEVILDTISNLDQIQPRHQFKLNFSEAPNIADALTVSGDSKLLSIAFSNLLDNASKFSDYQPVSIKLGFEPEGINIFIQDNGIGIPEKDHKHIFDPLYRAGNARAYKGFGIGLSLTQKIIELHSGTLKLESLPHHGTTVTVSLPF